MSILQLSLKFVAVRSGVFGVRRGRRPRKMTTGAAISCRTAATSLKPRLRPPSLAATSIRAGARGARFCSIRHREADEASHNAPAIRH